MALVLLVFFVFESGCLDQSMELSLKISFIRPASHRFGEARDKTNTHTHWHAVASKDYYVWNEYVHICFANLIIKEVYDMDFWNFADKVFVKSNDFFSFVVKKMCFVWIPLKNESTISWKFNISFILIFSNYPFSCYKN